jgi:hypothetical protein
VTFQEGTSPKLEKVIIEDCHSDLTICGISSLQSLKEILHFERRKLVKVDRSQQNVETRTHGSHPLLEAEQSQSSYDWRDAKTYMGTKEPELLKHHPLYRVKLRQEREFAFNT